MRKSYFVDIMYMDLFKLIVLTVVLFIMHYMLKKRQTEGMENTKRCSDDSINDAYRYYVFGGLLK